MAITRAASTRSRPCRSAMVRRPQPTASSSTSPLRRGRSRFARSLHVNGADTDEQGVNGDDFYASAPAVLPTVGLSSFEPARPQGARPAPKRAPVWPWLAAAVGLLALLVGLAVLLWPHSTTSNAPDVPMARLFGQQTRTQLPQPVTSDDCSAAVKAFPKIAADAKARAAFVDGCTH